MESFQIEAILRFEGASRREMWLLNNIPTEDKALLTHIINMEMFRAINSLYDVDVENHASESLLS